jgi:hypothetical protein
MKALFRVVVFMLTGMGLAMGQDKAQPLVAKADDGISALERLHQLSENRIVSSDTGDERATKEKLWRETFEVLLKKDENFAAAWRIYAEGFDSTPLFGSGNLSHNLCVSAMRDSAGVLHWVVVNYAHTMFVPGSGRIDWYEFDPKGKFESGGVYETGGRLVVETASVEKDGSLLVLNAKSFFGSSCYRQFYQLEKRGLVFQSALDPADKEISADDCKKRAMGVSICRTVQ